MNRTLILLLYNMLLPFVFILAFPGWVIKMHKRGGFGTGLLERLCFFERKEESEKKGVIYVHAVSVGEVFIALKLVRKWQAADSAVSFVLAATTATGHAIAKENAPQDVRVIYSPVDFGFLIRKVIRRFKPRLIVLIESEMWPNLLHVCQKAEIPVAVANARLSRRSEVRYRKLKFLVSPIFSMVDMILVQEKTDVQRWESIGVPKDVIKHTGSIKYDHVGSEQPSKRAEFSVMLEKYSMGRKIVMLMSSFPTEERAIAEALFCLNKEVFLVVVPRHMERREEVVTDLTAVGYSPVLRSAIKDLDAENVSLIIDSTGELRDWTAHADIAIIGKSWGEKGGQNH